MRMALKVWCPSGRCSIIVSNNKYINNYGQHNMTYSNDELLQLLLNFFKQHGHSPTASELVVSKELFRRRFGSFSAALVLAGLPTNKRTENQMQSTCKQCNATFTAVRANQQFCSHSCRATFTNTRRTIHRKSPAAKTECIECSKLHTNLVFCSRSCQNEAIQRQFAAGELQSRRTLRKQLDTTKCSSCGISEWQGVKIPLELDHIDGDASNNLPSNLRILCPNCHSITPTWKSNNKGSGRKSRGLPLS